MGEIWRGGGKNIYGEIYTPAAKVVEAAEETEEEAGSDLDTAGSAKKKVSLHLDYIRIGRNLIDKSGSVGKTVKLSHSTTEFFADNLDQFCHF